MPYKVSVDENYDYTDESERYALGIYETYDEAVNAAKEIVDESLYSFCKSGMTAEELFAAYRGWGEDPFIVAEPPDSNVLPVFSARGYAQERCSEVCAEDAARLAARPWWQFWRRGQ